MILKFQALSQVAKYVTRTYSSKPYAEISDESCLRKGCHETRLLQGTATFKRGIKFDHKPHLTDMKRGKKLRCTSCHSQIVVGNHMEVTESTCFLCHFRGAVVGREMNPIGGCGDKCHKAPEKDIKFGTMTFNHKDFVGSRHVACQNCHLDAIQGTGARGVPNRPSPMFTMNVDCPACHYVRKMGPEAVQFLGQTYRAGEDGCIKCHGEDFRGILDEWHKTIKDAVDVLAKAKTDAEAALAASKK